MSPINNLTKEEFQWLCFYLHSKNLLNQKRLRWYKRGQTLRNTGASQNVLKQYDKTVKYFSTEISKITAVGKPKLLALKRKASFRLEKNPSNKYTGIFYGEKSRIFGYGKNETSWQWSNVFRGIESYAKEYETNLAIQTMLF